MAQTFLEIKNRVRALTGRKSAGQLSDTDLGAVVNRAYQSKVPKEIKVFEFEGAATFDTVAGTATQTIPVMYLAIYGPWTITDSDGLTTFLSYYSDPSAFYVDYPDDGYDETTERAQPTGILNFAGVLTMRPIPDDVYTVGYFYQSKTPTALVDDSDEPVGDWGELIAAIAAVEILEGKGENEEAATPYRIWDRERTLINRQKLIQDTKEGRRAFPRF